MLIGPETVGDTDRILAWRPVLAGAAGVTKPRNPRLLYQGAPYGVGYLVASWS